VEQSNKVEAAVHLLLARLVVLAALATAETVRLHPSPVLPLLMQVAGLVDRIREAIAPEQQEQVVVGQLQLQLDQPGLQIRAVVVAAALTTAALIMVVVVARVLSLLKFRQLFTPLFQVA
jgi:hypothetical protein